MSKIVKKISAGIVGIGTAVAVTAGNAMAVDLSTVTMDMTNVESLALKIVAGLAILWGLRKVIKTVNKS